MDKWIYELIESYYNFLKQKTTVITETGSNCAVISTPFMVIGFFNDIIEIYITEENNKIILSDGSVTLKNLKLIGSVRTQ